MIKTKLDAMNAANEALSKVQKESGALAGMYDLTTGEPTRHSNGSLERLIVDVIDDSFDVEGEEGPAAAMRNITKWFGDMARELGYVGDALSDLIPDDEEDEEEAA